MSFGWYAEFYAGVNEYECKRSEWHQSYSEKKSHIQVNETRHAFDEDWLDERVTV